MDLNPQSSHSRSNLFAFFSLFLVSVSVLCFHSEVRGYMNGSDVPFSLSHRLTNNKAASLAALRLPPPLYHHVPALRVEQDKQPHYVEVERGVITFIGTRFPKIINISTEIHR